MDTSGQIFQNSFLADNSSKGVREYYLKEQNIISIDSFPERDDPKKRVFESVKMSVCILISKKIILPNYTFKLNTHKNRTRLNFRTVTFEKVEIFEFDPTNCVIPNLEEKEKAIFRKYYKSKSNKSYADLFNCFEGELNMTFHRDYMTNDNSLPLIIKGAQVQRYFITNSPSQGTIQYVNSSKYLKDNSRSKKAYHHRLKRIALQGISGANDEVRLISTLINENVFCANSCNYIIENESNKHFPVLALLGIFNSKFTNWIFRKTSTNSNVNCYEVNSLKLPTMNQAQITLMENLVSKILIHKSNSEDTAMLENLIDIIVYKLYDIQFEEINIIDPDFVFSEQEFKNVKC